MRLLVFGRHGQVARELARAAPGALCLGRAEADLARPGSAAAAVAAHAPEAVINAAAFTAVDAAESEEAAAMALNATAPGEMARACAARGIPLLHLSTDYVFDGSGHRPWRPDDPVAPLNAYGRSKLAGEQAVRAAGGTSLILRTAWVFSAHGANFVKTMLRLSETRGHLRVVADQWGGPTPAAAIARALLSMAEALRADPARAGAFHFAGAPVTSWAGFARETLSRAGRKITVEEIATADWPTPARRPLNSRLDCTATEAAFGIRQPDWRAGLDAVLAELAAGQGAGADAPDTAIPGAEQHE